MGRQPEGWTLRRDPRTGHFFVRFRFEQQRYNLTTGTADPDRAAQEAARRYAEIVSGRRGKAGLRRKCSSHDLLIPAAGWLADLSATLDPATCKTYFLYVKVHWAPFFGTLDRVTEASAHDYVVARLRKVVRATLIKELSALRGFLSWCRAAEYLEEVPRVESPTKRTTGTRRRPKREPVVLTEAEQKKVIAQLPEWCESARWGTRFPVRARFEVAWETALRPATLDELRAPGDWRGGRPTLTIRDEVDKARFGRELPLTAKARAALGRIAGDGVIFGAHDYRGPLRAAALRAGLPKEKAARLSPYDFRHSRLTALGAKTTNLVGLQFLAGHKHASTTARYLHAQQSAAAEVLHAAGGSFSGRRFGSPKSRRPPSRAPRRPKS